MKLELAKMISDRFMKYLLPYVSVMSVAGSVRRECAEVGDIEICCVPKDEFSMGIAFPEGYLGMVVNGTRLKRFKYAPKDLLSIQLELYITTERDYGRILAIRTGSSAFSHHLAMRWNKIGLCGTVDGLRYKRECDHKGSIWRIKPEYKNCPTLPPPFHTEEEFFAFIGVEWVHPKARSWVSSKPEYNYNV